jgi:tetratricopeptide (TPR) repeat protein
MANLMDAAATVENNAAARLLIDRLKPFANQVIVPLGPAVNGAVARPLARCATVLGDYDQAEDWFVIAHDINARLRAPFWITRAQLDHADLCLTRRADGDVERARDFVTTAAATAAEYGCAGLSQRAADLLADLQA